MSRSDRLTLLLLLAVAPSIDAQQARLRTRADSLLAEWRDARTLADLQDSLRVATQLAGRDTVRVGALRIIANPSPLPVEQAAALAWPVIEGFYGAAAQAFRHHPIVLNAIDPDTASGPPTPQPGLQVTWDLSARQLARLLCAVADLSAEDSGLHDWLAGPLLPADSAVAARRGQVYVQLVVAPSIVARRCLAGDRAACRQALTLDPAPDPAEQWYGPDERRRLVSENFAGEFDKGARQHAWRACRTGGDSSCLDLLHTLPPGSLPQPLGTESRFALLEIALELGGPQTMQRLFAAPPGPMGGRLATAAQVSEDSLVARWQAAILAARPHSVSLPPAGALLALGWVGVFAACGLRSSRWRAG